MISESLADLEENLYDCQMSTLRVIACVDLMSGDKPASWELEYTGALFLRNNFTYEYLVADMAWHLVHDFDMSGDNDDKKSILESFGSDCDTYNIHYDLARVVNGCYLMCYAYVRALRQEMENGKTSYLLGTEKTIGCARRRLSLVLKV